MDFLQENHLEQPLLERQLVAKWGDVMGPMINSLTRSVEIKNSVLYVKVKSAALRQQLFECRFDLVKKMNESVGAEVIRDVRLS